MEALLVGNGLNQRAHTLPGWDALFREAIQIDGFTLQRCLTPTLEFELNARNATKLEPTKTENQILRDIASYITKKAASSPPGWENRIHKALLECAPKTILTTNYDYYLEQTIKDDYRPGPVETNERRYSFRRTRTVGDHTIYHIHGEASAPFSICLGFERYIGSIQYMRTALTKPSGHRFHLYHVLTGEESKQGNCWYYSFFTDDLYILGLGLDAAEQDLWWLLNYRAELMERYPGLIKNKIVYLETDAENDEEPSEAAIAQIAQKLQDATDKPWSVLYGLGDALFRAGTKKRTVRQKRALLEAFQVTVHDCTVPNDVPDDWDKVYEKRYRRALDFLTAHKNMS